MPRTGCAAAALVTTLAVCWPTWRWRLEFVERGRDLAYRLRVALGDTWHVEYWPEPTQPQDYAYAVVADSDAEGTSPAHSRPDVVMAIPEPVPVADRVADAAARRNEVAAVLRSSGSPSRLTERRLLQRHGENREPASTPAVSAAGRGGRVPGGRLTRRDR